MTEENFNTAVWDRHADIDPKFTKPITGKPYKGTSPNPHYVIWCLTDMFGPAGIGFGWDVEAEGFQPMGDELLHWCRIRFWHGDGKGFSAYGQTKAIMKTKSGLMNDEDAPKKSLTDAITKAAATVGVGANIFLGRWDDSKYVAEVAAGYENKAAPKVSAEQTATLENMATRAKTDRAAVFAAMKVQGDSWSDLPANLFDRVSKGIAEKLAKMDAEKETDNE